MVRFVSLLCLFIGAQVFAYDINDVNTPEKALMQLKKGNKRYVDGTMLNPNRSEKRRIDIAAEQQPFAVIVGCSDSRVAPEIVFDRGIGDLFIVRVAGNVISEIELESIEYSVLHLKSVLVVVMGHESCGAIDAVINGQGSDIETIAQILEPSVEDAKKSRTKNVLESATKLNATRMKNILLQHPALRKLIREKKLAIQAAYYHVDTGVVQYL